MPTGTPVWIIGRNGQLARSLQSVSARTGQPVQTLARPELDLANTSGIEDALARQLDQCGPPAAIINCAAYTQVDQAETEIDLAMQINADAPVHLAAFGAAHGIPLLHVSTDYVFDGRSDRAYREQDPTSPINVYGRSKLAGETALLASNSPVLVLRTSWVFSGYGSNFLRTMLQLARHRAEVQVVADQIGAPTAAEDIAATLLDLAKRMAQTPGKIHGLYHYAGDTDLSWAEFATRIFAASRSLGGPTCYVDRISTAEFGATAARPRNSRLDCSRIRTELGLLRPSLEKAVSTAVKMALAD